VQQRINLEIVRRFEAEGIQFAFPTQTLHLIDTPRALS
jgi:small-conductance mechanosensitive channel